MRDYLLFLAVYAVSCCHGYRYGPPMSACGDMFPSEHGYDAQESEPPFKMTLDKTEYLPGEVITVNLTSEKNPNNPEEWFFEGILVQARTFNCEAILAVGSFQVSNGEDFLQPIDCFAKPNSTLRHYAHAHIYNRTFTWTAPNTPVGHVYLRATIARNRSIFWTNLYSAIIKDKSSTDPVPTTEAFCPVATKYTSSASGVVTSIVLLLSVLVTSILLI